MYYDNNNERLTYKTYMIGLELGNACRKYTNEYIVQSNLQLNLVNHGLLIVRGYLKFI